MVSARGMRFEWEKLVTPLTSKAVISEFQGRAGEIARFKQEASSVPTQVEAIDWAHWEETISTPGLVAKMKSEYEALNFPVFNPQSAENQEKYAAIESEIVQAEKQKALGATELLEVDKVIETMTKVKAEGLTWDLKKWQAFFPGVEEQQKQEYEDEDYLVSDESLKLDSVDWKAASDEFVQGVNPEIGNAPEQIGDMSTSEELNLVKDGKWSIARLFASKAERADIQKRVESVMS